ncbi:MAG: hypothetical protein Q8M15_03980 [Bacteroidota bacterium]|nr:hypothetical protein [Bacteroidota bacterium]
MKLKIYSLAFLMVGIFSYQTAHAQADAAQFLKAGKEDGNKLINAYLKPLFDGFGASLNNGWYNTARPHGILGFDVSFTLNLVPISESQKTFDATTLNLNSDLSKPRMVLVGSNGTSIPTIYGDDKTSTSIKVVQRFNASDPASDSVITSFPFPPGLNQPYGVGLPTIQAAVGVGFGTEVMLRITPKLTADNFKAGMFGFGVKHSISQWIWTDKEKKPPIDISGIFGYSSLNAEFSMGDNYLKPDSTYPGALPDADYKSSQKMTFTGNGMMIGAVVSKKLAFLTVYVGGNYNTSKVSLKMEGKYPVTFIETDVASTNFGKRKIINFDDPINIESSLNYFRGTAGVRIKLLILTINGEYNIGKVNTISVGLGINLQSIKPFKL